MAKKSPAAPYKITTPKRESTSKFSTTWKRPSSAGSGEAAYDKQHIKWEAITKTRKTVDDKQSWVKDDPRVLRNADINKADTSGNVTLTRKNYYPLNENRHLTAIRVSVSGINNCGTASAGPTSLEFKKPKTPTASFEYDDDTGILKITIKAPYDEICDKYDCAYKVYRKDNGTGSSRYKDGKNVLALGPGGKELSGSNTKNSFTLETNVESPYLANNASILFTVKLTSRGFVGETSNTETFEISPPLQAKITKVDLSNKDVLNLVNNLAGKQFANGCVRVFYRSASGPTTAAYDKKNPAEFTLQRMVSSWAVNSVRKADLQPSSSWVDVDTNAGSTSESNKKYQKAVNRYTDKKVTKKLGVWYYTAYDNKLGKTKTNIPGWKKASYSAVKFVDANGKKRKRYTDFQKAKRRKVYFWKAYDKKTKSWVRNIPPWEKSKYKTAEYKLKKKTVLRYKSIQKDGAARRINYYSVYDNAKHETVKNIPQYSIAKTMSTTYNPVSNPSDGVMGEPILDVLGDMGFTEDGAVFDKRVWYRVKTERFGIPRYSQAYEAVEFRAPVPNISSDYTGFMRIAQNPREAGTSIIGTIGWDNKDKTDEGIDNPNWKKADWSTIVAWSEHADAYISNEEPSTLELTEDQFNSSKRHGIRYDDYVAAVKNGSFGTKRNGYSSNEPVPWKASADFVIYGLEPGVPVYLWGMRHMVLESFDLKGPRTSAPTEPAGYFPFTPIDNPSQVQVFTPEYYTYGKDLTISFAHNAVCDQKSWNVYVIPAEPSYIDAHYKEDETNVEDILKKLVASGTGKAESVTIPAEVLTNIMGTKACVATKDKTTKAFSIIKQLGIVVGVSTGGKEVFSCANSNGKYTEANYLKIVHPPTCGMYTPSMYVGSNSRVVFLFTNTPSSYGVVNIYARQTTYMRLPDGDHHQTAGECVWSYLVPESKFKKPEKVLTEAQRKSANITTYLERYKYVAIVQIPKDLKTLYDGASYSVEGKTISTIDTSQVSQTQLSEVTCSYTHQARRPGSMSRIEASLDEAYIQKRVNKAYNGADVKDNYLTVPPTAHIYIAKPDSSYSKYDRCRVYRITPDGGEMIADNVPYERIVVDRYAPFSKVALTRYAIMSITRPGDMNWIELGYDLKRHGMRFDWGDLSNERSVELPFDIELDKSYTKNARVDTYLDGTVAARFNPGVTKTESVSTKLVKLQDPMQFEMVQELAQYVGTAFFRAHDGSAYECLVQVDGLTNSFDSLVSPVKLTLTRVSLTDRFRPQASQITMV